MNREIKFRAWDRFGKVMVSWTAMTQTAFNHEYGPSLLYRIFTNSGPLECDLMQFTGLHDRNSVEIYEGDIVNFTYWWFDGDERESNLSGEIVYEPAHMSFSLKGIKNEEWLRHVAGDQGESDTSPFAFFNFDEADFEVIGNIYENGDLLEKG